MNDPVSWLHDLHYALFEFAVGFFCWRAVCRYELSAVERATSWLGLQVLFTGIVLNGAGGWGSFNFMILFLLVAGWQGTPRPQVPFLPRAWIVLLGVLPLLAVFLRPVGEADSLFNLHFVFGWLDHKESIYRFAFHYVPFWEVNYTPSLVLGQSDAFLWVVSLKAIALLGLLLWPIAEEFALSGKWRAMAVVNAILFVHLWHGPSGLATIKNDMIAAAGQAALAMLMLRLGRGQFASFEKWLLVAGAVFVSTKYSGPVLLVLVLPIVFWQVRAKLRGQWEWLALGMAAWLASVGHVYIHNAWVFGNPVYPFQLNLGPIRLPGLGDLTNTSILYNLHNAELWQLFFAPTGGLSPLGLLFPVTLAVLPFVLIWSLRGTRRGFGLFALACLFVYLRSVYSASGQPGDLQFVRNDLNSFRYFEGAYLAAELFMASLLMRWPRAAMSMLAISAASRIWILAERAMPASAPDWSLFLPGCALGIAAVLAAWRWPKLVPAALLLLLPAGALIVESRRAAWLPQWDALYGPLYRAGSQSVFLIVDDEYSEQACAHLAFKGDGFRHSVRTGPLKELRDERFVVWIRRPNQQPPVLAGFGERYRNDAGIVYERSGR